MKRFKMKVYLLLTLLLGVFLLPGCGSDADNGHWVAPEVGAKAITAYSLNGTSGIISEKTTPKTIEVIMPYGTDLSLPMTATWLTTGKSVFIGSAEQFTALPPTNIFTPGTPKVYTVNPADGSAPAIYNVNVSVALASDSKITSYSLNGTVGTISEGTTPKTIGVVMPFGTDLTLPLTATYVTTGKTVKIGTAVQESGVTPNVFPLSPPASAIYTVTAADDVTTATYNVNVTLAEGNIATITEYSLNGTVGTISEGTTPKTIAVVMPFGTDLTLPLTATYVTTGKTVKIGTAVQESGITTNVFPLSPPASAIYTVTAADDVTTAIYNVNVTLAAGSAATITEYSLNGTVGTISEGTTPKTIAVVMPSGTDLTLPLTATYVTTGTTVRIGSAVQESGVTPNVFPLSPPASAIYTVTAADGVTTATYNINVTVAESLVANPFAPVLGEAGRFVILASSAVTGGAGSAISNGDIGVTPAARSFMTGFTVSPETDSPKGSEGAFTQLVNGLSFAPNDVNPLPFPYPLHYATTPVGAPWTTTGAMLTQAAGDKVIAYDFLAADPNPNTLVATQVCPIELGGKVLTRGVYKTALDVTISTGALQLDAQGDANSVWIFSIDQNLTTGASGSISFVGGIGNPNNVYWRVAGITTIGPGTTFYGNVFNAQKIDLLAGANVTGRLFSYTAVNLISNIVTKAP